MKRCELCNSVARMFCDSDRAVLCWDCDARVHAANFLVAKHSRTLLCHACQSPTPWSGTGPRLGPTVSVCDKCAQTTTKNPDDDDGGMQTDTDGEDDDDEDESDGDDEEDDEGDNQVVPLSFTPLDPPPVSSSSSGEESSSSGRFSGRRGVIRSMIGLSSKRNR